jgi:hypothetical protein
MAAVANVCKSVHMPFTSFLELVLVPQLLIPGTQLFGTSTQFYFLAAGRSYFGPSDLDRLKALKIF